MSELALTRKRSTWVTYGQMGIFGWFLYSLGPALALLSDEQNTSPVVMSVHMSAMAVGTMFSGTVIPRVVGRIGRGRTLRIGTALASISLLLLVSAPNPVLSIAATFVIGSAAAIIVTVNTSFLNVEHGELSAAAVSEANSLAALGGLISPLVMGYLVSLGFGWRWGFVFAVASFIAVEFFRGSLAHYGESTPVTKDEKVTMPRAYWWAWAVVGLNAGIEFILTLWAVDLLRERAGLTEAIAVAAITSFTLGMFLGRLVIGKLATRFNPEKLLLATMFSTLAVFAVFWAIPQGTVMLICLFGLGAAMAGHWPLGIVRLVQAGGAHPDKAASLSTFATGSTGMLLPIALGAAAEVVSVHQAFLLFPLVLLAGIAIVMTHPATSTAQQN